ncbi:hypothetical protein [Humibacter ginsengisoli]
MLTQDGQERSMPIPDDDPILNEGLKWSCFDWEKWWVISCTDRDDLVIFEGYRPDNPAPFNGRPSVYLDQNHWSTLAQAQFSPERVIRPGELEAARRLIALAEDGGVVLPLSSATLVETTRLGNDRRYEVGVAVARLAAGWQMRHPLEVRLVEFAGLFSRRFKIAPPAISALPVVSLEPYSALQMEPRSYALSPDSGLLLQMLTGASVTLATLIDADPIPSAVPDDWVKLNQSFAQELALKPRRERRALAWAAAWLDNSESINQALSVLELPREVLASIATRAIPEVLGTLPMVNRFSELMIRRHLNPNRRWRPNDLTDMMYLACADAYCDYVVAERSTGSQLQEIDRAAGQPGRVHVSIASLVRQLAADGIETAAGRGLPGVTTCLG